MTDMREKPGGGFQVEALTPALAARVPELAYKTFGYSHKDSRVYDPARLIRETADGKLDLIICTDAAGVPRAMVNLDFDFPSPRIAEIDKLMVDPEIGESQGGPLLRLLLDALRTRMRTLVEHHDMRALISLETTAHQLSQRLVRELGFTTAGLLLGRVPAGRNRLRNPPNQRGMHEGPVVEAPGRYTRILSVRPFRRNTPLQTLCVPDCFEALIRDIYMEFRVQFEFARGGIPEGVTAIESTVDCGVGLARIEVLKLGADFADALLDWLFHYRGGFIEVVHFVLPLQGADINGAVKTLLDAGCVFAGVLPEFRCGPALILQSVDKDKLAGVERGMLSPRAAKIWADAMGSAVPACVAAPETTRANLQRLG